MSARQKYDPARLKIAVLAVLPDLLREWLPGGQQVGDEYIAFNPRRVDRTLGSFRINTRSGRWRDHAIGEGGSDAVSLYAYLRENGDYIGALKTLANHPLVTAALATGALAPPARAAQPAIVTADKLELVRRWYASGHKLPGTPAECYLYSRGLHQTSGWECLRAHRLPYAGLGRQPCLIAPIRALDGSMVGLHCTYLTAAGTKLGVADPRRSFGQVRGCAIWLGEPADRLIICEGLEDGLTLSQRLDGCAVWVACGATNLAAMAIPGSVKVLTIAPDNDAPGKLAARRAVDAFSVGGREVRIVPPKPSFKDFNDQLRNIKSEDFRHA